MLTDKRILLVENDQDFSYLLYTLFTQEYFSVLPVFNSGEIIDRCLEFQPQLICLNLDLLSVDRVKTPAFEAGRFNDRVTHE